MGKLFFQLMQKLSCCLPCTVLTRETVCVPPGTSFQEGQGWAGTAGLPGEALHPTTGVCCRYMLGEIKPVLLK